jgi:hypothetical protein
MKLTLPQLRKLIKEAVRATQTSVKISTGPNGLPTITKGALAKIAPEALTAPMNLGGDQEELDENLEMIWLITSKPKKVRNPYDDDDDDEITYTGTDEPELGEWIADEWKNYAVSINGKKMVVLCGTYDDEYGYIWNNTGKEWISYAF